MPLPPRSYYHLSELAEAWGSSVLELASYVMDGVLDISVMVICRRVEVGNYEECEEVLHSVPSDFRVLNGPQTVMAEDLWTIFQNGSGEIVRFKPQAGNDYINLRDDSDPIKISLNDLLITREERERFERRHGLVEDGSEAPVFTHNETFTEVSLHGRNYSVGGVQGAVLRQLHAVSNSNNPWIHGKTLLRNAGAGSKRMVDLFKGSAHWKELIAADRHGQYRLKLDKHCTPEARERVYRRFRWSFPAVVAPHLS